MSEEITTLTLEKYEGGYSVDMRACGVRVRKRLKRFDKTAARAWAYREGLDEARQKAEKQALKKGAPPKRKKYATYADAVELYLSRGKYLDGVQHSLEHFKDWQCKDITPDDVMDWAKVRYSTPSMINRCGIAAVRAVLNEAARRQWCGRFTMAMVEEERKERRAADDKWTEAMCAFFKTNPRYHGLPEMLLFGQVTSHRVDELYQMKWVDIDWEAQVCPIPKAKKSKGRPVKIDIPDAMVEPLKRLELEQRRLAFSNEKIEGLHHHTKARLKGGRVFGYACKHTVWKNWARAVKEAKLRHLTPHEAMRHTFATWAHNVLGMSANDIAAAGYWAAGSVPMLQKTYIHSDKTSNDVAKAMASMRGLSMLNAGSEGENQ